MTPATPTTTTPEWMRDAREQWGVVLAQYGDPRGYGVRQMSFYEAADKIAAIIARHAPPVPVAPAREGDDSARLDWLEKNGSGYVTMRDYDKNEWLLTNAFGCTIGPTLRQAIDQAMRTTATGAPGDGEGK